jgi:KipI family sensor histidine kinase inhibitor
MITWYEYSEDVLVFRCNATPKHAEAIRQQLKNSVDVIITDSELAVQYQSENPSILAKEILSILKMDFPQVNPQEFIVPVCYDFGLDWEVLENVLHLSRQEIETLHQSVEYNVAYGFSPGFLYLAGLPMALHCPRRDAPRVKVPAGAVGLAGAKSGIYSLETPGGWQIIGRTPMTLFDVNAKVPTVIPQGSIVKFNTISKEEFMSYESA